MEYNLVNWKRVPIVMLGTERQQTISQLVTRQGVVNVGELAQRFNISASTIRRDLEQLEQQGLIRRIHGGAASLRVGKMPQPEFSVGRIGRAAAMRISDGETVYLGPGRLTMETAKALASKERVTVITNCLDIAHWLANNAQLPVIITGGMVGRSRDGLFGPLVTYTLRSLRTDRVIIEAAGLSPDQGLMALDLVQVELCRELIQSPGETVALVPPQRIGRVGGALVGPANDVDVIVTGREAAEATLWDLSQLGITIISV